MPQIIGPCSNCAPATFAQAIADLAVTRTLVGYWRLGDPTGVFVESSGYNADGLGSADATLVPRSVALTRHITGALPAAQDDGAVQLNDPTAAGSDYLAIPAKAGRFVLAGNQTVVAFVNPTASVAAFTGVAGNIAFTTVPVGWGLGVYFGTGFYRRETDTGGVARIQTAALPLGAWSFLVGTYSTVSGHTLYLNAVSAATDATLFAGQPVGTNAPAIGNQLTFGGGAVESQFYGGIDEVSVWADTLTAAEITTLYAAAQ